ncbi:YfjI family protein [Pseudomonas oryzihabitans]|jgi:putative DNA primase/helicase|uniref:YfjI family protein n=1 Tax=Pseudomonas oryzihabitans TaxID=47885 RepID=UPI00255666A1|nr:YfjI family protein [Pseudomonas oryzihabitans]MDK8265647.1 YfjI family protein [Pseudomonas oryzihabitans]
MNTPNTSIDLTDAQLEGKFWETEQDNGEDTSSRMEDWIKIKDADTQRADYPIYALPEIILKAVEEVHAYVQAPLPMIVASALAAVSTCIQGLASVERDSATRGPASLYFLTLAESGERKSTCDGFFSKAIREWETRQAQHKQTEMKKHNARHANWLEFGHGIKKELQKFAQEGALPFSSINSSRMEQHALAEPKPPRIAQLLIGDATPEKLLKELEAFPVRSILSAEAGLILGSAGMKEDSLMTTLSQFNVCWDGGTIQRHRISGDSDASVSAMRLTMGLLVQPDTMKKFTSKSDLAKGIGFFARFLFSFPESTQGTREYREPGTTPAVTAFNARVSHLLETPIKVNEDGVLETTWLKFDPAARDAWVSFVNDIEAMIPTQFKDIKDIASKAGDNVARIAACFHVFEGSGGDISGQNIWRATTLMEWYLKEACRYAGDFETSQAVEDALSMYAWLVKRVNRPAARGNCFVSKREFQQNVNPKILRSDAKRRNEAAAILDEHKYIKIVVKVRHDSKEGYLVNLYPAMEER